MKRHLECMELEALDIQVGTTRKGLKGRTERFGERLKSWLTPTVLESHPV